MLRIAIFSIVLICSALADSALIGKQPMLDGRIVGGNNVDITQHPHQISMRYNGRHRCGGSLIRANIVLTAAHCVVGTDKTLMHIVAGNTLLSETGVSLPVSQIITHNKYSSLNNDYDVAILVLNGEFKFSDKIKTISLAESRPEAGSKVTVTGWGALVQNGSGSNHLQSVDLNLVDNSVCVKSYLSSRILTSRMMCAGGPPGGKDSCQGDSGGPLTFDGKQLGIVSWGFGCAKSSFPGVYASVPDFYAWIEETANANAI